MSDGNLPPGVTDDMIPGNRPEDSAWEQFHEWVDEVIPGRLSVEEAFAIAGWDGAWQRGSATVYGWTWYGFRTQDQMKQFLQVWVPDEPAPG